MALYKMFCLLTYLVTWKTEMQQHICTVFIYGLPYVIGQTIYIFILFLSFFSSPNLSGRKLDVCHTSTHGVALVRI